MPTITFLNLPKEKQDNLMKAAKLEFMNYKLQDVSINRIINEAKIPRGSFYMYFEGKEDLYFYFLDKEHSKVMKNVKEILNKNKGDIFVSLLEVYDNFSNHVLTNEYKKYFFNVIASLNGMTKDQLHEHGPKKDLEEITSMIDYSLLGEKEYANDIMEAFIHLLMHTLIKVFKGQLEKEDGRKHVSNFINIIKRGIC